MNLYEVLELLIENCPLAEVERGRCLDIIKQLRDLNALGSTIAVTGGQIHEYIRSTEGARNAPIEKCAYCGKRKPNV